MRLEKLDPPINLDYDHVLGSPDAELTLVEYGSYACPRCHAVHEVIAGLRSRQTSSCDPSSRGRGTWCYR